MRRSPAARCDLREGVSASTLEGACFRPPGDRRCDRRKPHSLSALGAHHSRQKRVRRLGGREDYYVAALTRGRAGKPIARCIAFRQQEPASLQIEIVASGGKIGRALCPLPGFTRQAATTCDFLLSDVLHRQSRNPTVATLSLFLRR
jgi:hypothetical protein